MRAWAWVWLVAACGQTADPVKEPEQSCIDEIPYDGLDQDCDGADLIDVDGDGYEGPSGSGPDCEDADSSIHPGAEEVPYDGIDQDCLNGDTLDADGDGHLSDDHGGDDCDDTNSAVYPGSPDPFNNGVDENCDGVDGLPLDLLLLDRSYALDLSDGNWVAPAGVGDLLASQLSDSFMLLEVVGAGASTVDLRIAPASAGVQDLCLPTSEVLGVDAAGIPDLTIEPASLSIWMTGIEIVLDQPSISGQFLSEFAGLRDVSFSAILDTRSLNQAFGLEGDDSATCDLVATFGVSCVVCPVGGQFCLDVQVEELQAPESSIDTVARTEADIAADSSCQ